jgi:hypothetical protein
MRFVTTGGCSFTIVRVTVPQHGVEVFILVTTGAGCGAAVLRAGQDQA